MKPSYTIYALGDHGITIDFGGLSSFNNILVLSLFHYIKKHVIEGVKDVIPAYSSLTIVYDPVQILSLVKRPKTAFLFMREKLEESLGAMEISTTKKAVNIIEIPVCYDLSFAPDIEFVAASHGITINEVISIHTSVMYRVYMIGFLPGFAYMASVDARIATPRKITPRNIVPAGSVGIAGEQTGIYPLSSPGGWQLIGRTPMKLFDAAKEDPTLFKPGDEVKFFSISIMEYNKMIQS